MELKKRPDHPDLRPSHFHVPKQRRNPEFAKKFGDLQRRIASSPKSREPSDADVESFEESYRKLKLHARWQ